MVKGVGQGPSSEVGAVLQYISWTHVGENLTIYKRLTAVSDGQIL